MGCHTVLEFNQSMAILNPSLISISRVSDSNLTLDIHPLMIDSSAALESPHPYPTGTIIHSPGGHFTYRVIGPCCRLFDREELPWPCCRIQWHSKEPSWRRIGRRFVADLAVRQAPSYAIEILGQEPSRSPLMLTLYWVKLAPPMREWWYSKRLPADWEWP
jgi:hypothetical protein